MLDDELYLMGTMALIFLQTKRLNPIPSYPIPTTKFGSIFFFWKVFGSISLLKEEERDGCHCFYFSSSTSIEAEQFKSDLRKQIRSHEVAIAELNSLSSSRAVYQKNINILFRTSIPKATVNEQKQLDLAKAKLQKLES